MFTDPLRLQIGRRWSDFVARLHNNSDCVMDKFGRKMLSETEPLYQILIMAAW